MEVTSKAIVLYFHHVGVSRRQHYTSMRQDQFAHVVELLDRAGRLACWTDALGGTKRRCQPAAAPVLLSFDDGDEETLETVPGILEPLGVTAMFFVVSGLIGAEAPLGSAPGRRRFADAELLREVIGRGHYIGAHGITHRSFERLCRREQRNEVAGSLDELERLLGVRPRAFAYPFGHAPKSTDDIGLPELAFATAGDDMCLHCTPDRVSRRYVPPLEPFEGWASFLECELERWDGVIDRHRCG